MDNYRILIIDDEPDILELMDITLSRMGHEVVTAITASDAIAQLQQQDFHFCLTDMKLPDGNGIELVEHIQDNHPHLPVAVITAHGNMELAIKAMKAGAYDFVSKPVSLEKLRQLVEQGIKTGASTPSPPSDRYRLIGESAKMKKLRQTIAKFARSHAPVFIEGASGTGKELVARQIHLQSARGDAPFIAINCGAIPDDLIESELFGHVKGSFTGAVSDNQGLFRAAEKGTVFLDEIGDLPLNLQVKLLRVLQEKSIRPVGAHHEQPINVRFISASHKNLGELVTEGKFRHDLYYRINVIGITIPPLHERPEDIQPIALHVLERLGRESGIHHSLGESAISALTNYSFPGNVRELENILERACAINESGTLEKVDLNLPDTPLSQFQTSLTQKTADMEEQAVKEALLDNKWNQSAAARQLGITLRQLRYRCQKLGLTRK